jgi:protoheme IX farnesyltransferase
MEHVAPLSLSSQIKTYVLLTKPGIIMGNLITAVAGFLLASQSHVDAALCFATLLGLSFIMAAACVLNNYIDRDADKKMKRTEHRALATGEISPLQAVLFSITLGVCGILLLALFSSLLALAIALAGLAVYVFFYSFLKYRSSYATLVGSIAGAVPPLVGYCAVRGQIDAGALILFAIIALWQMPHFFAIALYRQDDYRAASIPVLPIQKGIAATKIQMVGYIAAFMLASSMLTLLHYTGWIYLTVAMVLGLAWLGLGIKGFKCSDDRAWARKMFIASLIVVTGLSAAISFSGFQ